MKPETKSTAKLDVVPGSSSKPRKPRTKAVLPANVEQALPVAMDKAADALVALAREAGMTFGETAQLFRAVLRMKGKDVQTRLWKHATLK